MMVRALAMTACLSWTPLFAADREQTEADVPLVRVGVRREQTLAQLHGDVRQREDGTLCLPVGGDWGWIASAQDDATRQSLEELESLTICGWARPVSLNVGAGGNRIAFNLNYNRSGFDLVHHRDGRLRLAINEWPDRVKNDSSTGRLRINRWVFFAVAYDGTRRKENVRWYFGTPDEPAVLDATTSYASGPTDPDSGPLTIGNFNATIQRHGSDRQFRGQLHAVQIFGSRDNEAGALNLERIREIQASETPDFAAQLPEDLAATAEAWDAVRQTDAAEVGFVAAQPPPGARPRVIATTDGEIDDRCSMIRFLLYANEWDIAGIIHSSSKFHWKGNGRDVERHNWEDEAWLDQQLDLYEQVLPNLLQHDPAYPRAKALRECVYTGNVVNVGDMSHDTPGSDRIVQVLLDDQPGPVYLQAWGGTNTIARALFKIQQKHPDQMERVSNKAIVYIILDQDATFREYIQPNWPQLQVLGSFRQFGCIAYRWERIIPDPQKTWFQQDWMQRNLLERHGPLCAIYEARDGAFRSEGDSPSFMHQIDVGLRSLEHPGWGGWGGRFVREKPGSSVWRDASDDGDLNRPIWRWAIAFQNDWAARADWCVKDRQHANHPPRAVVTGELNRSVQPGDRVKLDARASSDPDGDALTFQWWQYTDVDTCRKVIDVVPKNDHSAASFLVPEEAGKTIHMILEVTDEGSPPLTRYQRVVFTIEG